MQQTKIMVLPVLILLAAAFLLISRPLQADDDPCKSLTIMYCTTCHNSERMCEAVEKKDKEAWKATLTVMGEYGEIDQATLDQVLDCVGKMKKGESEVCKKE